MRARTNLLLALTGLGLAGMLLASCKTPAPVPTAAAGATVQPAAPAPTTQPAGPDTAKGAPKIEAAEKAVDLGDVRQGEKATHTFVLKNVGTDVLHIRKAKGS
jgi:hypothetical protein